MIRHVQVCHVPSQVNSSGPGCRSRKADEIALLPSSLRAESGRPLLTCFTETNRCAKPDGHEYLPLTYATCGLFGSMRTTPVCTAFAPPLWLLVGSANATEVVPMTASAATASETANIRFLFIFLPLDRRRRHDHLRSLARGFRVRGGADLAPWCEAPMVDLDERIERIGTQPFRAKFHLRGRDRATAILRGPSAIRQHAHDLITQRLAPATPRNDGKQTPYRGHPVFVGQHA